MRRFGATDAYEQLKELTRGEAIDQAGLQAFVDQLDLPAEAREALRELTPASYIGIATELTENLPEYIKKHAK